MNPVPWTVLLLSLALTSPAWASDIHVDDDAPGGDGGSWASAHSTLQDALLRAHSGDRILLAGGSYRPDQGGGQARGDRNASFVVPGGCVLEGGYRGLAGGGDPYDRDPELYRSTLTGDLAADGPYGNDNSFNVVLSTGEGIVFDGLTIEAGRANGPDDGTKRGAGMNFTAAEVTVVNCVLQHNRARHGSAISAMFSSLTIEDTLFLSNHGATGGTGDGLDVVGGATFLDGCHWSDNRSDNGDSVGAAVHVDGGALLVAVDCTFSSASSETAAGIFAEDADVTLTRCDFSHLTAADEAGALWSRSGDLRLEQCTFQDTLANRGGALLARDEGSVTILDCVFEGCTAWVEQGGAVLAFGLTELTILDSTFVANHATLSGGALRVIGVSTRVERCLFEGNSCGKTGGGAWLDTGLEPVEVLECTFRANSCEGPGGGLALSILSGQQASVVDTVFEGNQGWHGGGLHAEGSDGSGSVRIRECRVTDNRSLVRGGGLCFEDAVLDVDGLLAASNECLEGASAGGGLRIDACHGSLRRATIAHNGVETDNGAGISVVVAGGPLRLYDSVVWGNDAHYFPGAYEEIYDPTGSLTVEFCCVRFGFDGLGNLAEDPLFVDSSTGDYTLQEASPCIDAGDPDSPIDQDCTRADQGAIAYVQWGLGRKYCMPAEPNSTGWPGRALAQGSRVIADDDLRIACDQLPPGELAMLFSSTLRGGAKALGGGGNALCVGVPFGVAKATATVVDGAGLATIPVDLAAIPVDRGTTVPAQPGETFYFQVVYRDGRHRRATNALSLRFE